MFVVMSIVLFGLRCDVASVICGAGRALDPLHESTVIPWCSEQVPRVPGEREGAHRARRSRRHRGQTPPECYLPECPKAQTYAETAFTSGAESCAPPSGGIAPIERFGTGTPFLIVSVMAARLPSLQIHV